MIDKIRTAQDAVSAINDGATIMVGGFLATGTPEILIDALVEKNVKDLTVIANDGGLPASVTGTTDRGVAKLLSAGMVKKLYASHVGMNPLIGQCMHDGTLECVLVPQGSLAEKIRAGGAGLGGVLTPTGVGTIVAEGKRVINIDGKDYLLEPPLKADFALVRASVADKFGNFSCALATKTFNYVMAMAAETVILGAETVNEIGEKHPDTYSIPGVFVDYVVGGEKPWQI